MPVDLNGPRFYTQQRKSNTVARYKKDIVLDIEKLIGFKLPSLIKVAKPTLEVLYDTLCISKG